MQTVKKNNNKFLSMTATMGRKAKVLSLPTAGMLNGITPQLRQKEERQLQIANSFKCVSLSL
jgi:hypothetical protein